MRTRVAEAIAASESGVKDFFEKTDLITKGAFILDATAAIRAMQIPSNRAVAHAADKLGMDPTKVAAVWMCIIEGELKDG